jgi:hypothetical protein
VKPFVNMPKKAQFLLLAAILGTGACGDKAVESGTEPAAEKDAVVATEQSAGEKIQPQYDGSVSKPGAPFTMSYRIIGTPIVGSPVAIDLRIESTLGPQPVTVSYRIADVSAMVLHEAQPAKIRLEPAANEDFVLQRVTVIPQREGRLYLNVDASIETDDGVSSTAMAVPIQVGAGGRELQEQGEVGVDENGEAVRILTPD